MWLVYIIENEAGQFYTGITTDIERRFAEHCSGNKGARFFRRSRPMHVRYLEAHVDRSTATRREAEIKKFKRNQKLALWHSLSKS